MDELDAMRTFLRVARAGSFSRAARQLGVSQGTVSRRVAELESSLGASLLHRTTRSVRLSEAGAAYFDACQRAVASVDRARAVASQDAATRGVLRAAVPLTYATAWLGRRLPRFLERYPDIDVQLLASNERVDLVAEGVDMALRIGEAGVQDAFGRALGTTHRLAVASPAYLAGRNPSLDALEREQVLLYGLADAGRAWSFERDGRECRVLPKPRVISDSGDVLRQIALGGGGVVVVPDWLVADDLCQGRLVQVFADVRFATSAIRAIWLGRRRPPGRVRAFVDWLVEEHAP